MKVYVIKSKQTKEYQTVVMDFIPDIRQSDIFIDYEVALAYCPSDCDVVECELMEKTELVEYTKQVRKEVVDKVYAVLEQAVPHDLCWSWDVIKKELEQIKGETK